MDKNNKPSESKAEKPLDEAKIKAETLPLEEIYQRLEEIIN